MSKERLSECEKALSFEMLENISLKTQIKELKRTIRWINEDKDWLEKENKRYREALEKIKLNVKICGNEEYFPKVVEEIVNKALEESE